MITKLSINNFKAFEEEIFKLGFLNILSGLNSSGKSSVIQSIRLLNEKKPLPDLGPLGQYIRSDMKGFNLKCEQKLIERNETIIFSYDRDGTTKKDKKIDGIVSYISADRLGPKNSLPLSIDEAITTVGSKGENIVDFLSKYENEWIGLPVPQALTASEGLGIRDNLTEWLGFISPGIKIKYSHDSNTDIGRTEFNGHRPVHVGFGLSYALPIIASVLIHASQLMAKKTESVLLLIENPEAHLHPSGQSKMGEMLARAASFGVQIIVETHSDHLLNGIRIAVKEKKIPHTEVNCYFFKSGSWDGINEEPATVENIEIDEHGMVDYWSDGFFDETEKSLQRLI